MGIVMRNSTTLTALSLLLASFSVQVNSAVYAQYSGVSSYRVPVPGVGTKIDYVGDDFEGDEWRFVHNMPKSSRELNERSNGPMAYSINRRWAEGPERGQPDVLKVIPTPSNGLPGSKKSLQITTLRSGIPGRNTNDVQQDDLILGIATRIGSTLQVAELPSCVVRVYLPEPSVWENRSGPHFGIRLGARTTARKPKEGFFAVGTEMRNEPYWPGIWIHFKSETTRGVEKDSAFLKIRSNSRGIDFKSKDIPAEQFGWWTFGMSMSADGQVHYFAKPGVEDLTKADFLISQFPYGYRAERLNSFFFNICNNNNGRTWSTPFVIDDPEVFVVNSSRVDQLVKRKIASQQRRTQRTTSSSRK